MAVPPRAQKLADEVRGLVVKALREADVGSGMHAFLVAEQVLRDLQSRRVLYQWKMEEDPNVRFADAAPTGDCPADVLRTIELGGLRYGLRILVQPTPAFETLEVLV